MLVEIKRAQKIVVQYIDENNQKVERQCDDLLARVILHETDHLNGKLIVDYVGFMKKRKIKKQLKAIKETKEK